MHLLCCLCAVDACQVGYSLSEPRYVHMPRCVCMCATRHRCQIPGTDPSGLLLGKLSSPGRKVGGQKKRGGGEKGWRDEEKNRSGLPIKLFRALVEYKEREEDWINKYYVKLLKHPWQPSHFRLLNSSRNRKAADGPHNTTDIWLTYAVLFLNFFQWCKMTLLPPSAALLSWGGWVKLPD